MFALALAAGAGRWTALLAATLMAADNLMLVHGRIATLDIYVVDVHDLGGRAVPARAARSRPASMLGIGATAKLVAPVPAAVLVALRAVPPSPGRCVRARPARARDVDRRRRPRSTSALLGALRPHRAAVRPADRARRSPAARSPTPRTCSLRRRPDEPARPDGDRVLPVGVADRPQADQLPQRHGHDRHARSTVDGPLPRPDQPADPAASRSRRWSLAAVAAWRRRAPDGGVALAWFAGTWLPFAALSLFWQRTSYLYYMVIVMPGHLPRGRAAASRGRGCRAGRSAGSWRSCSPPPCSPTRSSRCRGQRLLSVPAPPLARAAGSATNAPCPRRDGNRCAMRRRSPVALALAAVALAARPRRRRRRLGRRADAPCGAATLATVAVGRSRRSRTTSTAAS